jgi:membrane protease YdiL (CAAX protease family)
MSAREPHSSFPQQWDATRNGADPQATVLGETLEGAVDKEPALELTPQAGPPQRRGWERGPWTDWPAWTAPAALASAFVMAVVGGLIVDIPAGILGAHITSSHVPGGVEIAGTVVQDCAFVLAAVIFAQVGGRVARAWQFGLRPPQLTPRRAVLAVLCTLALFYLFSLLWGIVVHVHEKEKLLESLGANEGTALLLLSAALTCVLAPVCEEFLFRGYFFQALSNWRGTWPAAVITGIVFGAVHAGSAPVVDLIPLGFLGFSLCVLYRYSGSLYLCIAVHAVNNSIAFGSLESWNLWQYAALMAAAGGAIVLLGVALTRLGVIAPEPALADVPAGA